MALTHQVAPYDYTESVKRVQKLLDDIRCSCLACSDGEDKTTNMPSATEIVDLVVDNILN